MEKYREEHDFRGEVKVPADKLWGAQTQRSHENFRIGIGHETMPSEIIYALKDRFRRKTVFFDKN